RVRKPRTCGAFCVLAIGKGWLHPSGIVVITVDTGDSFRLCGRRGRLADNGVMMDSLAEPQHKHLDDAFFDRDAQLVARELLGTVIRHCVDGLWLSARIIETEAYYI